MGAWVRRGARARLLAANEGVHAVLPARCRALRALHCRAQAACRVVEMRCQMRCQEREKEGMRSELAISEVAIDDRSEAWSVPLGSAHLLLTAVGRQKEG